MSTPVLPPARPRVPVRTIAATIGMVLATVLVLLLVRQVERVLVWLVIAAFFAVALDPLVNLVQRRLRAKRWLATLLVFLLALIILVGLATLFVVPLVQQGSQLIDKAPGYLDDARNGKGTIGELAQRFKLQSYLEKNSARFRQGASGLGAPALHVLSAAAQSIAGGVTIFVLAYLMVLEGPKIVNGGFTLLPENRRDRVRHVAADCARTVTGYLSGNLLISVICGVLTYVVLLVTGVPYAGLIALFVALADLIPLIGATIGAVVAVAAAFTHSVSAGIAVAIFFVIYQQLENHLLQPVILSRTVKLNPLAVLVAILIGVELAGILGTLLAIPVAGVIQVIVRDVYDHRSGRLKATPTVGEDLQPVDAPDKGSSPA
jgi:predicted PurR-regulated permease PerM